MTEHGAYAHERGGGDAGIGGWGGS